MTKIQNMKRGVSEIGDLKNVVASASFTIGTEAGNAINVAIQLKDWNGADINYRAGLVWYLSSDATGDTISAAPASGIAIGTDGLLIEWTNNVSGWVVSESDGDIDVTITDAGTPTFYLNLILPGGKLVTSGAITFA